MGLFTAVYEKLRKGLTRTSEALSLRRLLSGKQLNPDLVRQVEKLLIRADVGVKTAIELRKDIQAAYERGEMQSGDEALAFLKKQLVSYFPAEDRRLKLRQPGEGPTVILVAGINGSGKTTSIAKIARSLTDEGRSVLLAAGDTFRAAAVAQLQEWAKRLGIEIIKGKQEGDPAAVAWDACDAAMARGVDALIVDTAGRLHTQDHLMKQLHKIRNVIAKKIEGAPHEVILVIDATTGQNGVNQAKIFSQEIDVTGIFLSKLDGTARGGIVIAIRETLNIPVKLIGVGETPADVEPFDPEKFVEAMFEQ